MTNLPSKLGPYEPQCRLGAGGMAETFVAIKRGPAGFEQRVCIKRVLPAYEGDQEFVRSFVEEARTSATLRHGNIVQVLDFAQAEDDGSHYLVLELIDGLDLRALTQRVPRLDAELTSLIASDLAAALEHAHTPDGSRGTIVHRDLSPSNVLISRAGEVKLTDFGIARVLGSQLRTASGVIKGKVPYMPPEYIASGRFDTRGDLFALGVLLFELVHGERPFDGESEIDTLRKIVAGERRPFTARVPPGLRVVIERLLSARPEDRFASASELLDALPGFAANQARRRLAELVRTPVSELPRSWPPESDDVPAKTVPLELAVRADKPPRSPLLPSRRALFSLAAASALLFAVLLTAFLRWQMRPAVAGERPQERSLPVLPRVAEQAGATTEEAPKPPAVAVTPPAPGAAPALELAPTSSQDKLPGTTPPTPTDELSKRARGNRQGSASERGELKVVVLPFGDIWVDDKFVGPAPQSLRLSAGSHVIGVGEGKQRERRTVHVTAGKRESAIFQLPR